MFKNKFDTYLRGAGYTLMKNFGLSVTQWPPCPLATWTFTLDGNRVTLHSLCGATGWEFGGSCEILSDLHYIHSFAGATDGSLASIHVNIIMMIKITEINSQSTPLLRSWSSRTCAIDCSTPSY